MTGELRRGFVTLITLFALFQTTNIRAQELTPLAYDIGSPVVTDIWVDPVSGDNSRNGSSRLQAVRTVAEAWERIPQGVTLTTTGYRIMLVAGDYPESSIPNYWESRYGTAQFPIIIQAADGRGTANLRGDINAFDIRYWYMIDFDIIPNPAGDTFHCERCDHLLLRGMEFDGGAGHEAHETIKINQSQYVYIEDSNVHNTYENAIDFVAVQYGHIVRNKIHDADDWCFYLKGGSAYFRIEGNEVYNCGTGGFTAGQGTGFEFMTSPWIHYDAYDLKVINNIIHDTVGAGLGVNGGYNILMAHNTLYRVGSRSHGIEVVFGGHGCDGDVATCAANNAAGGWGPTTIPDSEYPIPNRNVFIYNNILYNPAGFRSADQHFAIYNPQTPPLGSNIPKPAVTDANLQIRGNQIWNGPADLPLGIEGSDACTNSNPTCNEAQLRAENTINTVQPQLTSPATGDFHPIQAGNVFSATTYTIPSFPGGDRQSTPLAPVGNLSNSVPRDYANTSRSSSQPAGAYTGPARARVAANGYLPWNGFLQMTNVLELINIGSSALNVSVGLYDLSGNSLSLTTFSIPGNSQQDVILNDLSGFSANSYGLVTLDYAGMNLEARVSFYKPTANSTQFDFAYAVPLLTPLTAESSVAFNTYQPGRSTAEQGRPVYNWLGVLNLDPNSSRSFTVHSYNANGVLLRSRTVTISPFARMDLEAGHESPGANNVGLQRIVPTTPTAPYFASLVRYGMGSGTEDFSFAFPLFPAPGGATTQHLPISTGAGVRNSSSNWVEVLNSSGSALNVNLDFYNSQGTRLAQLPLNLPAHAQIHLNTNIYLGANASGNVQLTAERAGALVAQSMNYFYGPAGNIEAMYGTPSESAAAGPKTGSYNLYLGMYNWLKLFNTTASSVSGTVEVFGVAGGSRQLPFTLRAHGALDLGLHDSTQFGTTQDSYGAVRVTGANIFSQVLRIRPDNVGGFDYAFPTRMR